MLHYGPALHVGVRGATDTQTSSFGSGPEQNWSTLTGCSSRILLTVVAGVMLTPGSSSARCRQCSPLARPASKYLVSNDC